MKDLIEYLARALVDNPDAVSVESYEDDDGTVVYEPAVRSVSIGCEPSRSTRPVRMVSVPPSGIASRALSAMFRIAPSSAAGSTKATPASPLVSVAI